ncbi:TPR-like protein [Pisolithus croceorrhizus]|nr:TPR-like protein [Pisolithus croceorrhizus]KAI6133220.1 TPR-like protein [Pisolithus croceorrhizus]
MAESCEKPPSSEDAASVKRCLDKVNDLKLEGNDLFKASKWTEALVAYRTALSHLPPRKHPVNRPADEDPSSSDNAETPDEHNKTPENTQPEAPTEDEVEFSKARAVVNANIAACLIKLNDNKGVIDACTSALEDDPHYIKALQRRAAASEKVDSWSSLARAQDDYKLLLELFPANSPEVPRIKRALQLLEPRVKAAQKRETDEMVDKLKGLGNSLLGRFGLSTDNFKFEPNGQGGYSMNFVR